MEWKQNKFSESCRRFRDHFPDFETFNRPGERYVRWERAGKDELLELYNREVRQELAASDSQFFRAYVKILKPAALHFVDWRFVDDLGTLSESESSKYGSILKRVIELDGRSGSLTRYGEEALECLRSVYEPADGLPYSEIRSLATLLLMLHRPGEFMCEKFGYWNKSAQLLMGVNLLKKGSQVTDKEFGECQDFANRVSEELDLAGFSPIDMIDVQGFLFTITGPRTWNQRAFESSLRKFKRRYSGFVDFGNPGEEYSQCQRKFKENILVRFRQNLKPLRGGDPIAFLNAYYQLINDDMDSQRPSGPEGWKVLTNEVPVEKKAIFGRLLQSLIDAMADDWSPTERYVKESYPLLNDEIVMGDSDNLMEKLCETATLLFSLNWPKYSVHATLDVWNSVAMKFHGRKLIEPDSVFEVEFFRKFNEFKGKIQEELAELNLHPTDMFDIQSLLWSVYDELSESSPDTVDDNPLVTTAYAVDKRLSLAELIEAIRSEGMRIDEGTVRQYHFSMRTRGFVILAGPSGVGKTWLTRLYAKVLNADYLLAPVAPNWSTNEDLLGFFNPIDGNFHATAFLDFIDRATESWERLGDDAPEFHLVLDEMNLARVEHYFSLFLSLMEMRRETEVPETRLTGDRVVRVPPNLKFAGTVNMDETTHGFADKVFDRAQLIELSISSDIAREHVSERIGDTPAAEVLMDLWDRMAPACPVGFRVLDDIADYLKLAEQEDVDWRVALDEQVVSKLLPKLRGLDPEVAEALRLIDTRVDGEFPRASAKCKSMVQRVQATDVVSFF